MQATFRSPQVSLREESSQPASTMAQRWQWTAQGFPSATVLLAVSRSLQCAHRILLVLRFVPMQRNSRLCQDEGVNSSSHSMVCCERVRVSSMRDRQRREAKEKNFQSSSYFPPRALTEPP